MADLKDKQLLSFNDKDNVFPKIEIDEVLDYTLESNKPIANKTVAAAIKSSMPVIIQVTDDKLRDDIGDYMFKPNITDVEAMADAKTNNAPIWLYFVTKNLFVPCAYDNGFKLYYTIIENNNIYQLIQTIQPPIGTDVMQDSPFAYNKITNDGNGNISYEQYIWNLGTILLKNTTNFISDKNIDTYLNIAFNKLLDSLSYTEVDYVGEVSTITSGGTIRDSLCILKYAGASGAGYTPGGYYLTQHNGNNYYDTLYTTKISGNKGTIIKATSDGETLYFALISNISTSSQTIQISMVELIDINTKTD